MSALLSININRFARGLLIFLVLDVLFVFFTFGLMYAAGQARIIPEQLMLLGTLVIMPLGAYILFSLRQIQQMFRDRQNIQWRLSSVERVGIVFISLLVLINITLNSYYLFFPEARTANTDLNGLIFSVGLARMAGIVFIEPLMLVIHNVSKPQK